MALALCLAFPAAALAWDYTISGTDTPSTIDAAATTAVVDTANREIRLPQRPVPDLVGFWESGEYDYVVLTTSGFRHYAFDGVQMQEIGILGRQDISNPVAVAARGNYPDVLVYDPGQQKLRHYSFTGSGMAENPALSVANLTGVLAIGTAGMSEVAALVDTEVRHYSFTGSGGMARNTMLEPAVPLNNPIDVALASGGYDTVVLEPDRVRWFSFTGSGTTENPSLKVLNLTNPVAVAVADPQSGYDIAVVEGTQVKHYSFDGNQLRYNDILSVTSGLTNPRAVAIRPGSYDRIIVDGNEVKYYSWTGSGLQYNPNLSKTVADIAQGGGYRSPAAALSQGRDPGYSVSWVRVRAAHELSPNTTVTWSVTADGTNWKKRWRVRGLAGGSTVLELTDDNGATWYAAGTAADALPSADNRALWVQVPAGRSVRWRADMETSDSNVMPKIATNPRGGVAVRWEADAPPNPPVPRSYGTCFPTTTPTLEWTFSDPDSGDYQTAYQVQIARASNLSVFLDTGKVLSGQTQYTVPTSSSPDVAGPLWSSGTYRYKYRVRVWDSKDIPSDWSAWADFCVAAFERPRIAQIVSPPPGQVSPDPANPATHLMILPGMTVAQLPKAKAGAKVVLLIDSVGPLNSVSWGFPYAGPQGSRTATVNVPANLPGGGSNPLYPAGSETNRWAVEFWTDPSLAVCPTGTVVGMQASGSGGVLAGLNAPPYAEGVVVTEGSIYADWFVVLQGRDAN